jgi:hypothetical protein
MLKCLDGNANLDAELERKNISSLVPRNHGFRVFVVR